MTTPLDLTYLSKARIVIVEDESAIRAFVARTLKDFGAQVYEADTIGLAQGALASWRADLLILDLGLPDGDGNDFIAEIRQKSRIPIIVLSARVQESEKVKALLAGADDYLTKPFGSSELLARTEAALRRANTGMTDLVHQETIRFADVEIDPAAHTLKKAGQLQHLTKVEWKLLSVLLQYRGKVLTHKQLLTEVWGLAASAHTHYLRIYIQRLRAKIEPDPVRPQYLVTEIGIGYRLNL